MKSPEEISETLNARKSTKEDYQTYIDNFDRTGAGAGSQKDPAKDRFSALDVRTMFDERGDLSKAEGAKMVLAYAKKAGEEGSSQGGGTEKALAKLRGYLDKDEPKAKEKPAEPDQMSDTLARANAGVRAFEKNILPNQGDVIFGRDKNAEGKSTNRENYLGDFALNLKANLKPVNPDGSKRQSKLRDEESAVMGSAMSKNFG